MISLSDNLKLWIYDIKGDLIRKADLAPISNKKLRKKS